MTNSRNKGAKFELEIASALNLELGLTFSRDLEQYRQSDRGDLICSDPSWPFLLELKRRANATKCAPEWWEQARKAAGIDLYPVVIWRADRQPVRVTMELRTAMEAIGRKHWSAQSGHLIDMNLETFCYVAREALCNPP